MSEPTPQAAYRVEVRASKREPWTPAELAPADPRTITPALDSARAALDLAVAALSGLKPYAGPPAAEARVIVPAGLPVPAPVKGTVPVPDGPAYSTPYTVKFARS